MRQFGDYVLRATTFHHNRSGTDGYRTVGINPVVPDQSTGELTLTNTRVYSSTSDTVEIRHTDHFSFIRVMLNETSFPQGFLTPEHSLTQATYSAYIEIFNAIKQGTLHPHLFRLWNYIPNILDTDNTNPDSSHTERYRLFNAGRRDAWINNAYDLRKLPAATGIGSLEGPLVIEAFLTDYDVTHLQNPRQKPSISYSKKYGHKPPAFARASYIESEAGEHYLFVSGTASIVEEDTVHIGDPHLQTKEIFTNIDALISPDNLQSNNLAGVNFTIADLHSMRVYVRRSEDFEVIKAEVERNIGQFSNVIYLMDDICRKDLLVEIELVLRKSN